MHQIADLRKEYKLQELQKSQVDTNPFLQLNKWLEEAIHAAVNEPTAMNLATVSANGRPSARIVLLKGLENEALIFYTNYKSRKGQELQAHAYAAITFFWPELERQVRVEGQISKVSEQVSNAYFSSRPADSQIGALASPQSQEIENRAQLEGMKREVEEIYSVVPLKRPAHWGGYSLKPDYYEFWQGRPSRLHDRIAYKIKEDGSWKIVRLAP